MKCRFNQNGSCRKFFKVNLEGKSPMAAWQWHYDFFRSEYTKHLQKTTLWFIDNIWCHEAIVLLPSSFTLKNLRRLPFWLNLHAKLHLWPYRSTSYIILFCQQEFFLHWNWLFSLLFITMFRCLAKYAHSNLHYQGDFSKDIDICL